MYVCGDWNIVYNGVNSVCMNMFEIDSRRQNTIFLNTSFEYINILFRNEDIIYYIFIIYNFII